MGFDLLTWPGHLCYTGDMGTYVFSRLPDMLEFFRGPTDGRIDFGYWAEKCLAADKHGDIHEFSEERFQSAVRADYESFAEDLTDDERADLWQQIEDDVLSHGDDEQDAINAACRFRWSRNGNSRGHAVFEDFWEHRLRDFTGRFVWCCYALRWAIAKYDASKAGESAKTLQDDPVARSKATEGSPHDLTTTSQVHPDLPDRTRQFLEAVTFTTPTEGIAESLLREWIPDENQP